MYSIKVCFEHLIRTYLFHHSERLYSSQEAKGLASTDQTFRTRLANKSPRMYLLFYLPYCRKFSRQLNFAISVRYFATLSFRDFGEFV